MTLHVPFDNSYARLPDRFFARQRPEPVARPALLALNRDLAAGLGLDPDALSAPEGLAMLAGNRLPDGAEPLAQAYAGHQFGGWVPQLGDGRAILLGEVVDRQGRRRDIQLKGAGPTPFSRSGDGRAWLGPVLREYLLSEAMHRLGVPTTRALAAVATGETVYRETALPGAVLTRVAASHIRVGTFQYFAARKDTDALTALTGHVIDRHYPDAGGALGLLDRVVAAQARLIAAWMGLGFVHGVMNTDNMSVAGETIDYGPCAFIDGYAPDKVFSSIDRAGRYAYARQPQIAGWNLAQLATALLPLIDDDRDRAVALATDSVNRLSPLFSAAWTDVFRAKLGLVSAQDDDDALAAGLLRLMADQGADFTRCFRGLANGRAGAEFADPGPFNDWAAAWKARVGREDRAASDAAMARANPAVIARNHRVEQVIAAAVAGDMGPFARLQAALADPFAANPAFEAAPAAEEEVRQTFCGT